MIWRMEREKRKQILDKLKKSDQIYDIDYDTLEEDLEKSLQNEIAEKKYLLESLLFEKELLEIKLDLLV